MNAINNEKIKTYDELNADEKDLIDCFRILKLSYDQTRFEFFSYLLEELLKKYGALIELRRETQALLFDVLDKLEQNDLSAIDVSYEKLGRNRQVEEDYINEEANIIREYKVGFDEALQLIYDGTAERILIEDENSW